MRSGEGKRSNLIARPASTLGERKESGRPARWRGGRSVHRRLVLDSVWALAALAVTPKVLEVGA